MEIETQNEKVDVRLKAVGKAAGMKNPNWSIGRDKTIAYIVSFVRNYLKCDAHETLFLYVNQKFAPSLDTDIGTLYDCYKADDKLVLHYSIGQAWG